MAKRRAIAIIDFLLDISRPPFSLFYENNAQDLHFIAQISKNLLVCFFVLDAKTVSAIKFLVKAKKKRRQMPSLFCF